HLHYVLFGGSVFTIFAGIYFWFPKITGRKLNRTLGEWNCWTLFVGFNGTFLIMHTLGLEGMPRRIATYANPAWAATNMIITVSSFLIAFSVLLFFINVIRSWYGGEIAGNDPWRANTLEWATTSPPPPYNFERVPPVRSFKRLRDLREAGELPAEPEPEPGPGWTCSRSCACPPSWWVWSTVTVEASGCLLRSTWALSVVCCWARRPRVRCSTTSASTTRSPARWARCWSWSSAAASVPASVSPRASPS